MVTASQGPGLAGAHLSTCLGRHPGRRGGGVGSHTRALRSSQV